MKKILLSSLIAAAAAIPAIAGIDNINYQAVIKNGNTVVADQKVAMKFELLNGSENVVYSEEQNPTTNAAGFVACQLGADNDLTTLDWGNLTLRVSIDFGSGYQVISSETVSSVPTAIYALHSADTDSIKAQVENLNMVSAVVRANEQAIDELNTNVDAFATMVETRLDKIQGQVDNFDTDFANLGENLDNLYTEIDARFAQVDGQLENLNQVAAVVRNNEENIEGIQGDFKNLGENLDNLYTEIDARLAEVDGQLENLNQVAAVVRVNEENIEEIQGDFKNLGENLDNLVTEMNAKFDDADKQIENLNMVAGIVRANEEAIEELNTNTEAFAVMVENRIDKLQGQVDGLADEVAEIKDTLNQLIEALRDLDILPTPMK